MSLNVAIIGGGPAGLMAAYRLSENSDIFVTIYEKGNDIEDRSCPIIAGKVNKCIKCKTCSVMEGIAGAGAFSDGKYNITTEFGGWLQDIIEPDTVIDYIEQSDNILVEHGATTERFMPNNELKKLCLQNGLYMLQSQCKHLGTDANFQTMVNIVNELKNRQNVQVCTKTTVVDVEEIDNKYSVCYENDELHTELADIVIFAVGRTGSSFFTKWCENNGIQMTNNQVDIGVRVELPSIIWEDFEKKIYEPKILYRTKQYGDLCRSFCFNGRGEVVNERVGNVITVNGHAYKSEDKKTQSTNFALLSTTNFTQPFTKPIEYAKYIAGLANMISGGSVIVQTLGDLERGRRSDESRIRKSVTKQTLKSAVAGDLSLCMPKRQLDNIIETLHALDKVAPGTANSDTLLYGVECKYYSARPKTNNNFEIEGHKNCYAIGDGAGFTRSLAQASAQGLLIADVIMGKEDFCE